MKKIISFFLVFTLIFCSFPLGNIKSEAAEEQLFSEYIMEMVGQYKTKIDISAFVIENNWDLDDIKLQLRYFYLSEPGLFYVDREFAIQYSKDFSKVILILDYIYSSSEAEKMMVEMRKAGLKAVQGVKEDMNDYEKALVVHDYIILNCSYDHKEEYYSAYDCLVRKSAVCQGYSLAYMYVMRDILGYDCTVVFTDSQNHSWNAIKLGKSWYHVDLTSDDPTFTTYSGKGYDGGGEVLHENFLLSDDGIYESSPLHRDWYAMDVVKAKNKRYDNYFWRRSSSAIFKVNGLWYYSVLDLDSPGLKSNSISSNIYTKICTFNPETGKSKTIKTVTSNWTVYRDPQSGEKLDGDYWYTRSFLKLVAIGNKIYYNTNKDIYSIDTRNGKVKKVYTLKKDDMQIYSLVPYGNVRFRVIYKKDISYPNKYITIKIK